MFILMPVIFVLGILAIALEDKIKINKAAIALFMAISLWMILMFDAYDIFVERSSPLFQEFLTQNPEMANAPLKDQFITFITNRSIVYHLGKASLLPLSAMALPYSPTAFSMFPSTQATCPALR